MATPALGALHPGVRFPRQLRYKSKLLFHWRAADAFLGHDPAAHLLKPVTGETPTFSRASAGGMTTDARGRLRQWAQGMPRLEMLDLDNDGIYETPGLLLEGARTNLCLRSEELNDAAWSLFEATVTPNADVAPNGALTADRIVESVATSAHFAAQNITATADVQYAFSCCLKAGPRTWARLNIRENATPGNAVDVWFNLATGVVGTAQNSGTATGAKGFIRKLGNGWYRCTAVGAVNNGATALSGTVRLATGDTNGSHAGDGASYISAWGAQFEDNVSFASSYIPTVGSSVARSNDNLQYTATDLASRLPEVGDVTLYARFGRAAVFDITSPVSQFYLRAGVGSVALMLWRFANETTLRAKIDTATTDAEATLAVPAGSAIEMVAQMRNLRSGGSVRLDVGGGFSAWSGAATPITALSNDTVAVGSGGTSGESFVPLCGVKIAAGLHTLDQVRRLF